MHRPPPHRLAAFHYMGPQRYFLTFCTFERRRVFESRGPVRLVLGQFERSAALEGFEILAYCFMPDHVHLLVDGRTDDADGRRFISRAKQRSGYHYAQAFNRRLWQRYGYERVLRGDEDTLAVVRYIIENPVRAQLVRSVTDYPFSGSSVYAMKDLVDVVAWSRRSG